MLRNFNIKNNKLVWGFTLVELMIVIVIIGILAIIAIASLRDQLLKSNDARRKSDLDRIRIATEEYEKDHNCYPSYVVCGNVPSQPIFPYLNNVPCDPVTKKSYIYTPQGSTICPTWYKFYSNFQYGSDPILKSGIGPNSAFNYVISSANAPVDVPTAPQSTNTPTSTPVGSTPAPTSPGGGTQSQYYGCKSGACVPIGWNPARPGPVCDPSFTDSNCYGQCGPVGVECVNVP